MYIYIHIHSYIYINPKSKWGGHQGLQWTLDRKLWAKSYWKSIWLGQVSPCDPALPKQTDGPATSVANQLPNPRPLHLTCLLNLAHSALAPENSWAHCKENKLSCTTLLAFSCWVHELTDQKRRRIYIYIYLYVYIYIHIHRWITPTYIYAYVYLKYQ